MNGREHPHLVAGDVRRLTLIYGVPISQSLLTSAATRVWLPSGHSLPNGNFKRMWIVHVD